MSSPSHIGDKGYIRLDIIIPRRKPANLPLHPDGRTYNQVRYKIERVVANIKTWHVLHTGYRRPLQTFPQPSQQSSDSYSPTPMNKFLSVAITYFSIYFI